MPSASEISTSLKEIEEALRQEGLARDLTSTRISRLAAQAFEDGERAARVISNLLQSEGENTTLARLTGDRQQAYFGFQKKAFLGFGASRNPDVRAAIAALPDEIRNLAKAEERLQDLSELRRKLLNTQSRSQTEPRTHTQSRTRTRSR